MLHCTDRDHSSTPQHHQQQATRSLTDYRPGRVDDDDRLAGHEGHVGEYIRRCSSEEEAVAGGIIANGERQNVRAITAALATQRARNNHIDSI